jgi:hypothetical protein
LIEKRFRVLSERSHSLPVSTVNKGEKPYPLQPDLSVASCNGIAAARERIKPSLMPRLGTSPRINSAMSAARGAEPAPSTRLVCGPRVPGNPRNQLATLRWARCGSVDIAPLNPRNQLATLRWARCGSVDIAPLSLTDRIGRPRYIDVRGDCVPAI